jgi:Abortive infection C-terminus
VSSLTLADRRTLEKFLKMEAGYVLNFSDRTFGEFVEEAVGVDIHSERYTKQGTSKANKLRTFWKIESDYLAGRLLLALIDYVTSLDTNSWPEVLELTNRSGKIAARLLGGGPSLDDLKTHAVKFNATYLAEQIRRLEASVENDPTLAIGTAKELVETCCKTILAERGKPVTGSPDISTLTKETLRELKLIPEGVADASRGADVIKRLLSNLGTIGNSLAELRGLYGTGHGKHGRASGLNTRHAKLAVGAAATLSRFLFETHQETR